VYSLPDSDHVYLHRPVALETEPNTISVCEAQHGNPKPVLEFPKTKILFWTKNTRYCNLCYSWWCSISKPNTGRPGTAQPKLVI